MLVEVESQIEGFPGRVGTVIKTETLPISKEEQHLVDFGTEQLWCLADECEVLED